MDRSVKNLVLIQSESESDKKMDINMDLGRSDLLTDLVVGEGEHRLGNDFFIIKYYYSEC